MFRDLISQIRMWCRGQAWWWRLPLLAWFAHLFIKLLSNSQNASFFGPLNLCIHEIGHLLFAWCGEFLMVAGGTITQLAAPLYGMWNFYRQKDFFAIGLCFGWLSTNFFNVSVYMADARSMNLDLVSLGDSSKIKHDWNYLLGHMGLLPFDHFLAGFVWFLGVLAMLLCLISGSWMIWNMIVLKKAESSLNNL